MNIHALNTHGTSKILTNVLYTNNLHHCPLHLILPPSGTFKLSLLYEERALAARTDGDVERAIALYTKAEKYAWEGTRVFGLINDRDMEAIVRGRAVGIDRYTHIIPLTYSSTYYSFRTYSCPHTYICAH